MDETWTISQLSREEKVSLILADLSLWNQKRKEEREKENDPNGSEQAEVDLREENFSGANLSGADLRKAKLQKANLAGADLSGADLIRADLSEANLEGIQNWKTPFYRLCNIWGVQNAPEGFREFVLSKRGVEEAPLGYGHKPGSRSDEK